MELLPQWTAPAGGILGHLPGVLGQLPEKSVPPFLPQLLVGLEHPCYGGPVFIAPRCAHLQRLNETVRLERETFEDQSESLLNGNNRFMRCETGKQRGYLVRVHCV